MNPAKRREIFFCKQRLHDTANFLYDYAQENRNLNDETL